MKEKKYNVLVILSSCNMFSVTLLCSLLWYVYDFLTSYQLFPFGFWFSVFCDLMFSICCSECLGRLIITISYYGLILNTSNLHGDPYINCFLSAVTEVPAYIIALLILQYCSRHFCQSSTLFLGGIMILCVHLIPIGNVQIVSS